MTERETLPPKPVTSRVNQGFNIRKEAGKYLARGWKPLPIRDREKKPVRKNWQHETITIDNVAEHFTTWGNVGVQFGPVSNDLGDVDLDCAEARAVASDLLPHTDAVFGRPSSPMSHFLYYSDAWEIAKKAAVKFNDPTRSPKQSEGSDHGDHGVGLLELRVGGRNKEGKDLGAVSVLPPSRHASGERVRWERNGEPARVDGGELIAAVGTVAAAALLVRYYPPDGVRHDVALVLSGWLARADWDEERIAGFIGAVARGAQDGEWQDRANTANGITKRLADGKEVAGEPRMRELFKDEIVDALADWLNIQVSHKLERHQGSSDEDALLDELAQLSPVEYAKRRAASAEQIGIGVKFLDQEIELRRGGSTDADLDTLQAPEPWLEPVDGERLLDELCEIIASHVVLSNPSATVATALWILHAHAHDAFPISPILFIGSPTKRCGKTLLLETVARFVPKPLSAANITPATIFRAIDRWHPTMLIDEVDTFLSDNSELRGVINSGHRKSGAFVLRCVGDDLVPKPFSTWAPKAFALIGRMHPTLEDRSIPIALKRKLKSEQVTRIPKDPNAYQVLLRKAARWVSDHMEELRTAEPQLPEQLNDRARDNWEPLLAIADSCGGDWPTRAREAAMKLSGTERDEEYGILLLQDLRQLFANAEGKNLASKMIAEMLAEMENRPWPEFSKGQPITTRAIAKLVEPFKIKSRQVRIGSRQVNGYMERQFTPAFERYLPGNP